jgi:hypothetical protein
MQADGLNWLLPVLSSGDNAVTELQWEVTDDQQLNLCWRQGGCDCQLTLQSVPEFDAFDLSLQITPKTDEMLAAVDCFGTGAKLNFHNLINYRNRHYTDAVWPELLLGATECQADTTSRDWQFAPHPTLMHFKRHDLYLSFGAMQLPVGTFGMHLNVAKYTVKQWFIDYGGSEHGHPLKAGHTFSLPTFRLALSQQANAFDTYAHFGDMLAAAGQLHVLSGPSEDWWRQPLYCTWMDQTYKSKTTNADELQLQAAKCDMPAKKVLTEQLVREAIEVIKANDLPFHTILLDEGWHRARGWWEPHPDRFPNLRQLVDELHDQGFKVVIWWGWPEIEEAAEPQIDRQYLKGDGKRNRYGKLMYDFSSSKVREEYLKPLFYRLFSSDEGCYDLDGIKTDFMADKIHADMPLADETWRGEENYLYHVHELIYGLLKHNKPDAVHIGCAGHYWLSSYIDINRTFDVHSSNVMEHENRARMLLSTTIDTPVAYDFHTFLDHLEDYFDSAGQLGCSVQIGNLLYDRQNPLAIPQNTKQNYWDRLVVKLKSHQWC